jgi:hypothetical protein
LNPNPGEDVTVTPFSQNLKMIEEMISKTAFSNYEIEGRLHLTCLWDKGKR